MAYIGPGAGVSFLGSLFSTLLVILLAIGAVLIWPLRYAWRRMRRLGREARDEQDAPQTMEANQAVSETDPQADRPAS